MARRPEARDGDAPNGDPSTKADDRATEPEDVEKTEAEKAKTEIDAGDVADDLADFA